MGRVSLDLEVLRSFVAGVELGSFAQAAERVSRSTSAVSAQLKKLEEQAGQPLLRKAGRGLVLTPAGEVMLAYARRLLALNDEAVQAVQGSGVQGGWLRFGMQEDFAETLLPTILGRFSRAHPQFGLDVKVARNQPLLDGLTRGELDLALVWDGGESWPHRQAMGTLPLHWIDSRESPCAWPGAAPVPLVLFEAPCLIRAAACTALEQAGHAWRQAFSSGSLSSLWAAVAAGLGVTVRTPAGLPETLMIRHDLPPLPAIRCLLCRAEDVPSPGVGRLADTVTRALQDYLRPLPGVALA
ncbi:MULTISPECIES: LysR substrate-binding domain-containing protein [unclassified Paludibacterium]|uniref:LysR substrate-binding domain-containing protein n=1 Tax=unclassified Paludibacterium TaxID=2618429 RepID=UPI001C0599B6|nr:LysR substrate-binding domain-containing protein [Paludibacterium sp. B53371]BEV71338.1 LysR substrate-binding domain-containing protein [Paludibacterium sp. THUN1379]